jgi:hypothetical protein
MRGRPPAMAGGIRELGISSWPVEGEPIRLAPSEAQRVPRAAPPRVVAVARGRSVFRHGPRRGSPWRPPRASNPGGDLNRNSVSPSPAGRPPTVLGMLAASPTLRSGLEVGSGNLRITVR